MGKIDKTIKLIRKQARQYHKPYVSSRTNPFKILISCLLSLRTRDETTEKVSKKLFSAASTPANLAKIDIKHLKKIIKPVNYYKTKAKRIHDIARIINEKGKVPSTMNELLKLNGIGRKTANIVMVYGFHKQGLPIDTHCHRIPNRLGWIRTKMPEQTEKELRKILPKRLWKDFNDIFVTFGQNVCKPVHPRCDICSVKAHCKYYRSLSS